MTSKKSEQLSCGGKGPCCHVGYPHRHCEHCDVVIATGYYPSLPTWPYRPYTSYWGTSGTLTEILAGGAAPAVTSQFSNANTGDFNKAIAALSQHACSTSGESS